MHLFRWPMDAWWENFLFAVSAAFLVAHFVELEFGLVVAAVSFLVIFFRWGRFYNLAEPQVHFEEKIKYTYPAHCIFAASLSAGCAAVSSFWGVAVILSKEFPEIDWPQQKWSVGFFALIILMRSVYNFYWHSKRIQYP